MREPQLLKDHFREARIFRHRVVVAAVLLIGLMGILVARFHNLQVVHHAGYVTQSDRNRVHVQVIPPTRGLIYDRNGVLLAENVPSYTLSIIKERVENLDKTIGVLKDLLPISDDDLEKFNKSIRQRRRPFEAVPLRYRLQEDEIARIAVNEYRLAGVEVEAQLVRHYPQGELFAHSIGYVGRINDRELAAFSPEQYERYSGIHITGKIGLEKYYEDILLGTAGHQNVETNARGQVLRVLDRSDPIPGANLTLHIDSKLQRATFDAFEGQRGAAVVIDTQTGGVLAMVSTPSFDPNLFVTGISFKDYRGLNNSLDLPLFNRALQAQYPPGSTVKPMLGLAGLHNGIIDSEYAIRDPGYYQLQGDERVHRDWKPRGHGNHVNLKLAIAQSCDTYFWDLAFRTGIDRMHNFGAQFGLGRRTGVDVPSERSGIWPSRTWKREARGLAWYPGDSLNMGLGQGFVLATPIQLALMTSTIANRGELKKPLLVNTIDGTAIEPESHNESNVLPEHWDTIFDAMEAVVHGGGTAKIIRKGTKYQLAGKTGTAQVVAIKQGEKYDSEALAERHRDHALFVAFAPVVNPRLATAVLVENGEKSSKAAKIARKVLDQWLLNEKGRYVAAAPPVSPQASVGGEG